MRFTKHASGNINPGPAAAGYALPLNSVDPDQLASLICNVCHLVSKFVSTICKQFRHSSDVTECGISSGFTLSATGLLEWGMPSGFTLFALVH